MATELMEKVLEYLAKHDEIDSLDLAKHFGVDHQRIIGAIKSLQAFDDVSFSSYFLFCTLIVSIGVILS